MVLIGMINPLVSIVVGLILGALIVGIVVWLLSRKQVANNHSGEFQQKLNEADSNLRVANDRLNRLEESKSLLAANLEQQTQLKDDLNSKLSSLTTTLDQQKKQIELLHEENQSLKIENKSKDTAFQEISRDYAAVKIKNESISENLESLKNEVDTLKVERKQLQTDLMTSKEKGVELDKENIYLKERLEKQKTEIEEIGKKFSNEFKLLAEGILEDKSKRFTELNQNNIEQLLKPLGENIQIFQKKVEEVYDKESKERFSLGREVEKLVMLNKKISEEANNLTSALKGQVKQQGNWGEMILESILEKSGLVKDREYFVQESYKDEEGRRFQPDVIIHYPDNRKVVIDSKVSLVAYERYCSSDNTDEQQKELTAHVRSVRNHIEILSSKRYQDLVGSLDFVTMFLPIEPAFIVAMQADPDLWNFAYAKGVLLLSPTNLIAALRLIHNLWQREYQNRHALEIAERGGQLYDKFVGFIESMTAVGDNLQKSQRNYDQAMNQLATGRGNLVTQTQKLKDLGAKAKKSLPESMLDSDDETNELMP